MKNVYLVIPNAPDKLLGRVSEDGKVYRREAGPDDYLGHVDLSSGKVYEQRFGPDQKIGHANLKNGRVYRSQLGPDEYMGRVDGDGHIHRHVSLDLDENIGRIEDFISYAHSAGAMLLLVLPAFEAKLPYEETIQE